MLTAAASAVLVTVAGALAITGTGPPPWMIYAACAPAIATLWAAAAQGRRTRTVERWAEQVAGRDPEPVEPGGKDEYAHIGRLLRETQLMTGQTSQLELVRKLTEAVSQKNDRLENVLEELQSTQDTMISNQKLAEMGQLTAGVAHEIRNPLHFVRNFAEASVEIAEDMNALVERVSGAAGGPEEERAKRLCQDLAGNMTRLAEHVGRADRIIEDMLAMGRGSDEDVTALDINDVVHNSAMLAFHACRAQARDNGADLTIRESYSEDAGTVWAKSQDLARVVVNMVSNACQSTVEHREAMGGRGDPMGWRPTVEVSTTREEGAVVMTVADNGPGIPADIQERIFSPFFTTRGNRGTGLGLSLTHEIIRAHGGDITVGSTDAGGALFTVRLPADSLAVKRAPPGESPPNSSTMVKGEPGNAE